MLTLDWDVAFLGCRYLLSVTVLHSRTFSFLQKGGFSYLLCDWEGWYQSRRGNGYRQTSGLCPEQIWSNTTVRRFWKETGIIGRDSAFSTSTEQCNDLWDADISLLPVLTLCCTVQMHTGKYWPDVRMDGHMKTSPNFITSQRETEWNAMIYWHSITMFDTDQNARTDKWGPARFRNMYSKKHIHESTNLSDLFHVWCSCSDATKITRKQPFQGKGFWWKLLRAVWSMRENILLGDLSFEQIDCTKISLVLSTSVKPFGTECSESCSGK